MVNIFGDRGKGNQGLRGAPGPVGPMGARGPKSSKGDTGCGGIDDACRWMPKLVLEQYQKNETCCFTLKDPGIDLHVGPGGAYTTWISHSNAKLNAVTIHPSKQILHISKTLPFTSNHNYTCICVTFQVEGEMSIYFH